jgi:PhnB protein
MSTPSDKTGSTFFAPHLFITDVAAAIDFYKKAFNATESQRWVNDDGTVHVAELYIENAIFHIHEDIPKSGELSPLTLKNTTVSIGMFVDNPHKVVAQAVQAGALEAIPVKDYDYGYQQGTIIDPFGHHWLIEKRI